MHVSVPIPLSVAALIAVGWLIWAIPFFLIRRGAGGATTVDRRARWGIVLEGVGFFLVWQPLWRIAMPGPGRFAGAVLAFAAAITLSWSSARRLGKQWRYDAGLRADHELIRSGAYAIVRHPIYTSMFCLLIATGLLLTTWVLLLAAMVFFVIGTEIRVRIEDRLLASRFGGEFDAYRRRVPAYIPFLRMG
jgi:protein-S-isoprenylcysteine O-methyltransferase Ste14